MGLEPIPVARLAPETSAYTNSAISAAINNIPSIPQKIDNRFHNFGVILRKFMEIHPL